MRLPRSGRRIALAVGFAVALVASGSAFALQKPGRTIVRDGQVRLVALNQASFAFMVARTTKDCDHVELWNTATKGSWRFGETGPCVDLGSTGTGISAVGVSGNRALWIRYTGGNTRDWQLMTATTTQKTPKQLRFIEQDVELPSPLPLQFAKHPARVYQVIVENAPGDVEQVPDHRVAERVSHGQSLLRRRQDSLAPQDRQLL